MKCAICGHADRDHVWQPFGPDENPLTIYPIKKHQPKFPKIPVCDFCWREQIKAGKEVSFDHWDLLYTFREGMPRPIARIVALEAASDLIIALHNALDLFSYEFLYANGDVINTESAGGAWVAQARAAIEKATQRGGSHGSMGKRAL